jgi:formylglycine-generating enzyme required for sulfatase activity
MKLEQIAAVVALLLLPCATSRATITIDTVPVGNVGNASDPATDYGGVGTAYNIGKYEVTVGQYTAFLNAVAAIDTYNLYNTNMASDGNIAGILRFGTSGFYSYSATGSGNHPITYVSWGDAARFANWLHNGQPIGFQNSSTTEDGAYALNGAITSTALMAVTRKAGAKWFVPTENEWYKAAYHQPAAAGGDSDGYWRYPMKTNFVPYSAIPPGASAPDPSRVGNFLKDDGVVNGYDDGYGATGSTFYSSSQNYLTDVGAYTSSPSYYGTFDQGGNVEEWNEAVIISSERGVLGGAFPFSFDDLRAGFRSSSRTPASEVGYIGFRVASSVPEPSAAALLIIGSVATLLSRRRSGGKLLFDHPGGRLAWA